MEYIGKYILGTFLERSQGCVRWKNIFQDQSSTTSNTQTAPSTSITRARAGQQNKILHHSVNLSVLNFLLFDKLYKTPGMRSLIKSFSEKPLKLELFLPWPKNSGGGMGRPDFMKNWTLKMASSGNCSGLPHRQPKGYPPAQIVQFF